MIYVDLFQISPYNRINAIEIYVAYILEQCTDQAASTFLAKMQHTGPDKNVLNIGDKYVLIMKPDYAEF